MRSFIAANASVEGRGVLNVGKFTSISWGERFEFSLNGNHDYKKVSSFALEWFGWSVPKEFYPPPGASWFAGGYSEQNACRIDICNDVWIGRGCILKSTNPNKPLTIGDGAVIASNSVVVKSVPPYAIVGGNPAKVIKYRFEPHVIESLLRIKWWDWSIDKIHDNFKYFNDVEKFCSMHDEQFKRPEKVIDDFDYLKAAEARISFNYSSNDFDYLNDVRNVISPREK